MTYTLDWSETDLGGSAVVSYAAGAVLDFTDKPAGATAALSLTANRGDSINTTIAEFSVQTSGSSVLTFAYHTSTESGYDFLRVDVDGSLQASYSGTVAWTTHAGISIPSAGTHTIRFRYQKDAGSASGQDRVWVALLNITNTVTVNDASGSVTTDTMEDGAIPSVVSTTSWTNSTSEPITGSRSLRSPAAPAANGSYNLSIAKAAGSGYATVGFNWKVSSENGYDKLIVFPDASAANVPSSGFPSSAGSPGWIDYSGSQSGRLAVIVPAAAQTILLRYAKDGGGNVGSDAAWIDGITLPAAGGGTTAGALSASLPRTTASITGATAAPTYTGTLSAAAPRATASLSGLAAGPTYAGTMSATVPRVTAVFAGTVAEPVYSGTLAATTPTLTSTITGTVTPPTYAGTVAATLPVATGTITGTATPPTYLGTLTAPFPPTRATITGTATNPAGSGTLSGVLPRTTATLTGTVVPPTWPGTLGGQLAPVTGAVLGTATGPVFTGALHGTLARVTGTLTGTAAAPTASGALVATLPNLVGSLAGVAAFDPGTIRDIRVISVDARWRTVELDTRTRPFAVEHRQRPVTFEERA